MTATEPDFAGAPEILDRLARETKRLTFEWGQGPIRGAETTEWVRWRARWAIAHAWLLSTGNQGFRVTCGGHWELELWGNGGRMSYTSAEPISPRTITRMINAMFDLRDTGEEDGK